MVNILSVTEYSESPLNLHKEIGRILCRRVYLFFIRPITRSMWIWNFNSIFEYLASSICFSFHKTRDFYSSTLHTYVVCYVKPSINKYDVIMLYVIQKATVMCYVLISSSLTPILGQEKYNTIGDDAYKKLYCLMFLICLGSCF